MDNPCFENKEPPQVHRDLTTGWDDVPGSGTVFIIDSLAIADFRRGFDLDGRCRSPGDCVDNSLWQLGQLGNDQIRQGLLGGETLLIVEIAGIDAPFFGDDAHVTIKVYGVRDADDPFFPANNFQIPAGGSKCCEFKIHPRSLDADGQARARIPAFIEDGVLRSKGAPRRLTLSLTIGVPPHPEIVLERAQVFARLTPELDNLSDGLMGGGFSVNNLAVIENPYCKTMNQLCPIELPDTSLLDLIGSMLQPDLDLDGDGLERVEGGTTGRVNVCLDGNEQLIPPLDPSAPWACAIRPEMADAYSASMTFHGVAARVVGVGQ